MKPEDRAWSRLHERAAAQLSPGFAQRVLVAARAGKAAAVVPRPVHARRRHGGPLLPGRDPFSDSAQRRGKPQSGGLAADRLRHAGRRPRPMRQRLSIALWWRSWPSRSGSSPASGPSGTSLCRRLPPAWAENFPPPSPAFGFHHGTPPDRADLARQVEALRPQLEAFRAKMIAIDDDFSRDFDTLLNADQRALHKQNLQRRADIRSHMGDGKSPNDDLIFALTEQSDRTILWDIVVPLRLDLLTRDLQARRRPAREDAGPAPGPAAEGDRPDRLVAASERHAEQARALRRAHGASRPRSRSAARARPGSLTESGLTAAARTL